MNYRKLVLFIVAPFGAMLVVAPASAHVKWFAPYNVPQQPVPLHGIFHPAFWQFVATAAVLLWVLSWAERQVLGQAILRSLDRLTGDLKPRVEMLYRGGGAVFFTALWVMGGIILTPELKTTSTFIPWLEFGIVICLFWRRTLILAALGIAFLYAYGVYAYGIFHMLDYPIFLGLAAYLGLTGLGLELFGRRPLDVARWAAALTLMWASIEKWAYPDWTYPVLDAHPNLALDLKPDFYMTAAGVLEFSLAFALLWSPLIRRLGALVLTMMFTSAVFEFGKIDAIGHSMIIVILLGVLCDDKPDTKPHPILAPVVYCGTLALYLAVYYALHAILFGTIIW
ncbi:MAG TPA: hypothetical protein VFC38_02305 [Stellaceae bacterium]|nr:hypothetical protein [Stellaceae bacterium]